MARVARSPSTAAVRTESPAWPERPAILEALTDHDADPPWSAETVAAMDRLIPAVVFGPRLAMARTVCVIVHPGSCYGSATMNVGRDVAGVFRDAIADAAKDADAAIVVHGMFADEVAHDVLSPWGSVGCLGSACAAADGVLAAMPDGDELAAAGRLIRAATPCCGRWICTGAWADRTSGCVDAVRAGIGRGATIDASALRTWYTWTRNPLRHG